ncbi:MAG: condensation domain-containing protein [Bryobacteraceae bacterium]
MEDSTIIGGDVSGGYEPLSAEEQAALDAWLSSNEPLTTAGSYTIPVDPHRVVAPASSGQEQIWMHSEMAGGHVLYNEAVTVHYHGEFDAVALNRSLNEFVRRHAAWRTSFAWHDGALQQVVHPRLEVPMPFTDLSGLSAGEREERAVSIACGDALIPFDLSRGPLLRCRLIRFSSTEHRLYLTLHHIIFDGVSLYGIFLPQLASLYRAYARGVQPHPHQPSVQYPDYADWHRKRMQGGELASQLQNLKEALSDLPTLDLRLDFSRGEVQSFHGSMERFLVPAAVAEGLRGIGNRTGATLFMVLTAVLAEQLRRRCGQVDLPLGSASSSRKWSETEDIVGFFLNTIVLRVDASGDPTFLQLVERVREVTIAALSRDDVPFPLLARELAPRRDASTHPLFQVMFSLEPPLGELDAGWRFTQMDVETGLTKFDLHLEMDERKEGILARYIYNTDLFFPDTIRAMAEDWQTIAKAVVASPDVPLSELSGERQAGLWWRLRGLFGKKKNGGSRAS